MNLSPLQPLLYYAAASILTIHCLRLPKGTRAACLAPVILLSVFSLCKVKNLSWPFGLDSTFASVVVFYLPYSAKLLLLDQLPPNPEIATREWSFVACYRIWNNPRNLPPLDPTEAKKWSNSSRSAYFVRQAAGAAGLWASDAIVFQTILVVALNNVTADDFSPANEFPRLAALSGRELFLRSVLSVQWCWSAYFFLEFYHSLLAILFVVVLRFDNPGEWPPLFGSIFEADSIRGFWGRFWHRLTIPTYVQYSTLISHRVLGLRPGSHEEKTLVPFLIFTFSGLSHSLVGWALGDAALLRDVVFFEISFFAAALETSFYRARKSGALGLTLPQLPRLLGKVVGMMTVFAFFFCVAPLWVYPKIYPHLAALTP